MKKHLSLLILFAVIVGYVGFGQAPVTFGVDTIRFDTSYNSEPSRPIWTNNNLSASSVIYGLNDSQFVVRKGNHSDTLKYGDSAYKYIFQAATIYEGTPPKVYEPEQDTIPCVMLVCDTTEFTYDTFYPLLVKHRDSGLVFMNDSANAKLTVIKNVNYAYWIKGYEVREKTYTHFHKQYLDENKQPLKSSIIVWLSK